MCKRLTRTAALLLVQLLAVSLSACGGPTPYANTVGVLRPRERIVVHIASGTVNAYAPAVGQPRDQFTIAAFASGKKTPAAPTVLPIHNGIQVTAPALSSLLVRVPHDVNLRVVSGDGDINVTDISGMAQAITSTGDIHMMLPAYGSAHVLRHGNITADIGAHSWPGTLAFTSQSGDVQVSVEGNVRFHVNLQTLDGMIYTDFNIRGTSRGTSEQIAAPVQGGSSRNLILRTSKGAIRLLKLVPQV
jgi:hypothetical protein